MEWTKNASPTSGAATHDDVRDSGDEWQTISSRYKEQWQEHYGASADAAHWERYEPRYRYAWEMRNHPDVAGKSWVMAQPGLRRTWEERYPDDSWDQAADTVRHAWEHAADGIARLDAGQANR